MKTPALLQTGRNEQKIPTVIQICEISKFESCRIDLRRGRFLFLHGLGRLQPDGACTAGVDPLRPFTTVSFGAIKSAFLLRRPLARFLELFPVRCVLECLIVLGECIFGAALLHKHVAPSFSADRPSVGRASLHP